MWDLFKRTVWFEKPSQQDQWKVRNWQVKIYEPETQTKVKKKVLRRLNVCFHKYQTVLSSERCQIKTSKDVSLIMGLFPQGPRYTTGHTTTSSTTVTLVVPLRGRHAMKSSPRGTQSLAISGPQWTRSSTRDPRRLSSSPAGTPSSQTGASLQGS